MQSGEKKNNIFSFLVLFSIGPIIVIVIGFVFFQVLYYSSDEYQIKKLFKSIAEGTRKEEVLNILGKPERSGIDCEYSAYDEDCIVARSKGAVKYLVWHGDLGTSFIIGIDGKNEVVFKTAFGS